MERGSSDPDNSGAEALLLQLAQEVNGTGGSDTTPEGVKLLNSKPLVYNYDDDHDEEVWSSERIQAELEGRDTTVTESKVVDDSTETVVDKAETDLKETHETATVEQSEPNIEVDVAVESEAGFQVQGDVVENVEVQDVATEELTVVDEAVVNESEVEINSSGEQGNLEVVEEIDDQNVELVDSIILTTETSDTTEVLEEAPFEKPESHDEIVVDAIEVVEEVVEQPNDANEDVEMQPYIEGNDTELEVQESSEVNVKKESSINIEEDTDVSVETHQLEELADDHTETVIDSNNLSMEAHDASSINEQVVGEDVEAHDESLEGEPFADGSTPVLVIRGDPSSGAGHNFQDAILEDWDAEGGATKDKEVTNPPEVYAEEEVPVNEMELELVHTFSPDAIKGNTKEEAKAIPLNLKNQQTPNGSPVQIKSRLSFAKISKEEVMKEILKTSAPPVSQVLPKKDLIFALELAKHSSQGPVPDIVKAEETTESDESLINNTPVKLGHDLEVSKELKPSILKNNNGITALDHPNFRLKRGGKPKQLSVSRIAKQQREEAKMRDRELALRQLAQDFHRKPKRRKGKDAPRVAADDLERALSSTPVLTNKRKRRPCYLPGVKLEEEQDDVVSPPSAIIKTYAPKRRSSDSLTEVKTALKTIAIVNKHLSQGEDEEETPKPTTPKPTKKVVPAKKRVRELQQLLGDEGAVRMLYDAAQKDSSGDGPSPRVFKNTKKGLMQQTKFVENAVLRSSGASEKSLRGKRLALGSEEPSSTPLDPLFPPAAPGLAEGTPAGRRKKPKAAEASRILYRHSSSESFDGSEGLRRSASEIAGLDASPERPTANSTAGSDAISKSAQRKSSRARKVSSKLAAYVAESIVPKKSKKVDSLLAVEVEKEKPAASPHRDVDAVFSPSVVEPKSASSKVLSSPAKSTRTFKKPSSEEVRVTQRGALVEIKLTPSRSSILNGFTPELLKELRIALKAAVDNVTCRAVLLTSDGEVFCQGVDLSLLEPGSDITPLVSAIKYLVLELSMMQKPLIAGVHGAAVGMGAAMLPLFDVVVASDAATFSTPYTRLGQGLEAAASFTFPRISKALVSELIYKGSKLTASDALRLGLVSQVVPAAKFTSELLSVAQAVASQSGQGLETSKELLIGPGKQSIEEAVERECASLLVSWTNAECLSAAAEMLASGQLLPSA